MGNNKQKQGQVTDEKKDENSQTPAAETPQTENPAPSETPTADDADKDGNASEQPKDENAEQKADSDAAKKTVKMVLKHKSHTPHYHRCGLTLTQVFTEYEVPKEAVAKLKADKWIVVKDSK